MTTQTQTQQARNRRANIRTMHASWRMERMMRSNAISGPETARALFWFFAWTRARHEWRSYEGGELTGQRRAERQSKAA